MSQAHTTPWLPASRLGPRLEACDRQVRQAHAEGWRLRGFYIERRPARVEDYERPEIHGNVQHLYRGVEGPRTVESVEDLEADLAGAEARIEELKRLLGQALDYCPKRLEERGRRALEQAV